MCKKCDEKSRALDALLLSNHKLELELAELRDKPPSIDHRELVKLLEEAVDYWKRKSEHFHELALVNQRERLEQLQRSTQNAATEVDFLTELDELFAALWARVSPISGERRWQDHRELFAAVHDMLGALERQTNAAQFFFEEIWALLGRDYDWTNGVEIVAEVAAELHATRSQSLGASVDDLEAIWLLCHPDRPRGWSSPAVVAAAITDKIDSLRSELELALRERLAFKIELDSLRRAYEHERRARLRVEHDLDRIAMIWVELSKELEELVDDRSLWPKTEHTPRIEALQKKLELVLIGVD